MELFKLLQVELCSLFSHDGYRWPWWHSSSYTIPRRHKTLCSSLYPKCPVVLWQFTAHQYLYDTLAAEKTANIQSAGQKPTKEKKKGSLTVEHFHGKGMPPSAGRKTACTELSCRNTGSHKVNHHLLSWWLTHGNCEIDRWQPHKHSTSFLSVWVIQGQIVDRPRSKELMKALGQVFHINACRNGATLCVSVSSSHRLHVKRSWFNNVII